MSLTGDVLGQIGAEVSLNGGVGGSIEFTGEGTDNYNELDNKPSINGVVLTGNKTTEDLHIDTGGTDDYLDLNNKPKINSVTLRGDVSSASLQISYNDLTDRPVIPDITDLENRMDAVEGDIQSIETDIGDIGDRLIDIASDIATIQATDLVQNSDISSLKSRMNAAENNIINLGSRLTTAEGTISTHTSDISGLDTRLDTAEGDISDLQGDVTNLDTIVGNGQQTVGSDLTDAVTQLNSSLSNHEVITSGMQVPIRIAQAGNLISLTLGSVITRAWGAYETYNVGTLPFKYRPPIDVCVPCVISDRSMIFRMYIKSTGTIDIYNPGGAISSNISVISGSTITYSIV